LPDGGAFHLRNQAIQFAVADVFPPARAAVHLIEQNPIGRRQCVSRLALKLREQPARYLIKRP
jgi:hypothetical protein